MIVFGEFGGVCQLERGYSINSVQNRICLGKRVRICNHTLLLLKRSLPEKKLILIYFLNPDFLYVVGKSISWMSQMAILPNLATNKALDPSAHLTTLQHTSTYHATDNPGMQQTGG